MLRTSRRLRLLVPVAALLAASAITPASASASATISRSSTTITIVSNAAADSIVADNSFASRLRVRYRNTAGALTPGAGCMRVPRTTWVDCGAIATSTSSMARLKARVTLGGGNDTFRGHLVSDRQPRLIIDGGAGNDRIFGTDQRDDIDGGGGDDALYGNDDTDALDGGAGSDILFGGNGNDVVDGGAGTDTLLGDVDGPSTTVWGSDRIIAFDFEVDVIACGNGTMDAASVDAGDNTTAGDCEALEGGQNTPAPAEGTLPITATLGVPTATRAGHLARGGLLHFPLTMSAAASVTGTLTISAAEARRVGLPASAIVLGNDVGIPFTTAPVSVNGQMRVVLGRRDELMVLLSRRSFTSVRATLRLRVQAIAGGDPVFVNRILTITR